jgi:membrane protease subunit HflK
LAPWNDNANPGPWGSPPGGEGDRPEDERPPRREEPRRRLPPPPPTGPDLGDLIRRLRAEWSRLLRGRRGQGLGGSALGAGVGIVVMIWLLTGFYIVQPYQEAIVTRFGAFARRELPGLRYHLPAPIERAERVDVTKQQKTIIGGSPGAEAPDESLMLTGDENIVDLSFAVQWHISDAAAYLFQVRDPDDAVKAVAESAMREVVGRSDLTSILTNGRGEVQGQTLDLMQRILDRYRAGVTIDAVQIQNANPPAEVVPAYQDIARAGQDAQSSINQANTYRNRVVNEAQGDSAKIIQAAEGYREQVVREAQGEAARFNQVYAQYRLAPAVTRQRLYIQTMQTVLSHTRKVIIDAKGATAPIILPPQAFQAAAPEAAAAPAPPAVAPAPQAGQAQGPGQ